MAKQKLWLTRDYVPLWKAENTPYCLWDYGTPLCTCKGCRATGSYIYGLRSRRRVEREALYKFCPEQFEEMFPHLKLEPGEWCEVELDPRLLRML